MGALGGGLSGLGGYNGLPSVMSGLDESMSDIEVRKKYPFELEKAMHNVMFIQHHMQRQDEFNAVSIRHITPTTVPWLNKRPCFSQSLLQPFNSVLLRPPISSFASFIIILSVTCS